MLSGLQFYTFRLGKYAARGVVHFKKKKKTGKRGKRKQDNIPIGYGLPMNQIVSVFLQISDSILGDEMVYTKVF